MSTDSLGGFEYDNGDYLITLKIWGDKMKQYMGEDRTERVAGGETKMAVEGSDIIICWKGGEMPTVYNDCEDIEWHDGNGYGQLQFTGISARKPTSLDVG